MLSRSPGREGGAHGSDKSGCSGEVQESETFDLVPVQWYWGKRLLDHARLVSDDVRDAERIPYSAGLSALYLPNILALISAELIDFFIICGRVASGGRVSTFVLVS